MRPFWRSTTLKSLTYPDSLTSATTSRSSLSSSRTVRSGEPQQFRVLVWLPALTIWSTSSSVWSSRTQQSQPFWSTVQTWDIFMPTVARTWPMPTWASASPGRTTRPSSASTFTRHPSSPSTHFRSSSKAFPTSSTLATWPGGPSTARGSPRCWGRCGRTTWSWRSCADHTGSPRPAPRSLTHCNTIEKSKHILSLLRFGTSEEIGMREDRAI